MELFQCAGGKGQRQNRLCLVPCNCSRQDTKKFFEPITGYDGLFAIRIEFESNIYRIFCCFDEGNLIVLFNGFQKKTQKIPKNEIERAMRIKEEYFELKKKGDKK